LFPITNDLVWLVEHAMSEHGEDIPMLTPRQIEIRETILLIERQINELRAILDCLYEDWERSQAPDLSVWIEAFPELSWGEE
jgi:hypothetical protein